MKTKKCKACGKPLVDDEFSDIIRNEMSNHEFWSWVACWYDVDSICKQAEEQLSVKEKKEVIKNFNKGLYNQDI